MRNLKEVIIYKDKLIKLQENLANLTGASIFIMDIEGNFVLKPSYASESCKIIDDTSEEASRYKEYFFNLVEKLKQAKVTFLSFCDNGFCKFAIPIILKDELLGVIIGCQAIPEGRKSGNEKKLSLLIDELGAEARLNPSPQFEKVVNSISEILTLFFNNELELNDLSKQMVNDYAELSLLYDISNIFASTFNAADASKYILERLCDIIEVERASLMLLDKETRELKIIFAKGIPDDVAKEIRVKPGEGIAGWVAKEGKPLLVKDIKDYPELQDLVLNQGRFKTKSFLTIPLICSPLKIENRIIGVINLADKESGREFTQHDLDLLSAISTQIALLIEHKRLFDDLRELLISTVRMLISVLESKDFYTSGHSQRVTECALAIADELNLSKAEKSNLELSGLLHDIGKIDVPKEILSKTTKLTEEEYGQIKMHSAKGIEILKHVKQLSETIPTILYHHERFDGKGYPEGLKGQDIPLPSRILAVADSFDAMTSSRSYRTAIPREEALEEIKRNAGTQFDPVVCEAFFRAFQKKNI